MSGSFRKTQGWLWGVTHLNKEKGEEKEYVCGGNGISTKNHDGAPPSLSHKHFSFFATYNWHHSLPFPRTRNRLSSFFLSHFLLLLLRHLLLALLLIRPPRRRHRAARVQAAVRELLLVGGLKKKLKKNKE